LGIVLSCLLVPDVRKTAWTPDGLVVRARRGAACQAGHHSCVRRMPVTLRHPAAEVGTAHLVDVQTVGTVPAWNVGTVPAFHAAVSVRRSTEIWVCAV